MNLDLVPVVLFAYKRPKELKITVESLIKCPEAKDSDLYVFCDGAKSEQERSKVDATREYVDALAKMNCFKSVMVEKSDKNMGLNTSIISGVSKVMAHYETAIVLEDDLSLAPTFLSFMNQALRFYKDDKSIGSVTGTSLPIGVNIKEDTYLSLIFSPWGWGTWKDRWSNIDWGMTYFNDLMAENNKKQRELYHKADPNLVEILKSQHAGLCNGWDVIFEHWQITEKKFTVVPAQTLVIHIGFGEDSTHHITNIVPDYEKQTMCNRKLKVSEIKPVPEFFEKMRSYLFRIFSLRPIICKLNEHGIKTDDNLIIYGTANWGREMYTTLEPGHNAICFSDSDKKKWGNYLYGLKIISPAQILEKDFDYILIASSASKEIKESLMNLGIEDEKIVMFDFMHTISESNEE